MKRCSKCQIETPLDEFYRNTTGYRSKCKECLKADSQSFRKRLSKAEGYKRRVWSALNCRTVNGLYPQNGDKHTRHYLAAGVKLELTKQEWSDFVDQNAQQIEAIYATGDLPSVDRIDNAGNYSLGNIRIIPKKENTRLGVQTHSDRCRPVREAKLAEKQAKRDAKAAIYADREARGVKRCCACKQDLPRDSFSKDATNWDGLQPKCKPCCSIAKAKYRATRKG